jgi:hypothetical protein
VRLTGWLDAEAAAIVHAALDPPCRPSPGDDRTPGQRALRPTASLRPAPSPPDPTSLLVILGKFPLAANGNLPRITRAGIDCPCRPWAGGGTDVDNGVLLCRHHHRLVHHARWDVELGPDRRPRFLPPARLDPLRRPRRNAYHPRTQDGTTHGETGFRAARRPLAAGVRAGRGAGAPGRLPAVHRPAQYGPVPSAASRRQPTGPGVNGAAGWAG